MAEFTFQKDPRVYARGVLKKVPERARVLGLDLATNTGAAFCDVIPGVAQEGITTYMDLWDLSVGIYDTSALRIIRLRQFLSIVDPDLITFEDVKYTPPADARGGPPGQHAAIVSRAASGGEFFGVLKGAVAVWAEENDVPCQGVGIGEIKKFAMQQATIVKKGTANKEDIIAACNAVFGTSFDAETYEKTGVDNMADAAFVMLVGVSAYSEGLEVPFTIGDPPLATKPKRKKVSSKKKT